MNKNFNSYDSKKTKLTLFLSISFTIKGKIKKFFVQNDTKIKKNIQNVCICILNL